jgi:hypothetical protein
MDSLGKQGNKRKLVDDERMDDLRKRVMAHHRSDSAVPDAKPMLTRCNVDIIHQVRVRYFVSLLCKGCAAITTDQRISAGADVDQICNNISHIVCRTGTWRPCYIPRAGNIITAVSTSKGGTNGKQQ